MALGLLEDPFPAECDLAVHVFDSAVKHVYRVVQSAPLFTF